MIHDIPILITGGTFKKRYDPKQGILVVPEEHTCLEEIIGNFTYPCMIEGLIHKDSLDMTDEDREKLSGKIASLSTNKIVVIHGTDTMDVSADYIAQRHHDKVIVFTGAMVPFSINAVEATSNLSLALGYAEAQEQCGVYIAIQGIVAPYKKIYKNRELGRFELVEN